MACFFVFKFFHNLTQCNSYYHDRVSSRGRFRITRDTRAHRTRTVASTKPRGRDVPSAASRSASASAWDSRVRAASHQTHWKHQAFAVKDPRPECPDSVIVVCLNIAGYNAYYMILFMKDLKVSITPHSLKNL